MPNTSGTFNSQSTEVELLIREAFENIGILGEFVESQKLESAKRSINFLLLEWMSKSINLWTIQKGYVGLVTGKAEYALPSYTDKVIQVNLRTSNRQRNGTAASSNGGVPANAFDGNPLTACTQNAVNGNISYDYGAGVTQQINFVGIQSNVERIYSLVVESSTDNATWTNLLIIAPQTFSLGVNVWFDIPVPVDARSYRIRETGGATLNIQEIYFNNNVFDQPISNVSRYEYFTYPTKKYQSRPSVYYYDRQIIPVLYVWSAPSNLYNCLQYSYTKMMEDAGLYTDALQIPARYYPALISGLAYKLALKYNPQVANDWMAKAERDFNVAAVQGTENTPISISVEWGN